MSTNGKITYALVLGLFGLMGQAQGIEPVNHIPIADLSATLKGNGQKRLAQGVEDVLAKDAKTGEIFTARSPLLLTSNQQSGDWTVSVVNDKVYGSILLTGTDLKRVSSDDVPQLSTFNLQSAEGYFPRLKGWDPTYYPDEIARLIGKGFRRVFTGRFSSTAEPTFQQIISPVFVDIVVDPKSTDFTVLVVDQYGTCAKIATGSLFSERN